LNSLLELSGNSDSEELFWKCGCVRQGTRHSLSCKIRREGLLDDDLRIGSENWKVFTAEVNKSKGKSLNKMGVSKRKECKIYFFSDRIWSILTLKEGVMLWYF